MGRMDLNGDQTGGLRFRKMHGLGNDFVIVDARAANNAVDADLARAIGHRNFGVGYDQLAVLKPSDAADVDVTFWNADGSLSDACGNASRCIARIVMEETGGDQMTLRTGFATLEAQRIGDLFSVNMGQPRWEWDQIPLMEECDTLSLPLDGAPSATSMGNPHCTYVVEDAEAVDLETLGAATEVHPLFPKRTNVQVASLLGRDHIRMRVWERGVGVTLASGSSSCATAVTFARRGLCGRKVQIDLDGGTLHIDWRDDGIWMTGPASHVFDGVLTPEFLAAAQ